jgi:NAD+ synthase (glutamine-hydrolysing)
VIESKSPFALQRLKALVCDAGQSLRSRDMAVSVSVPHVIFADFVGQDHFLENDLYLHSWQMMSDILLDESCYGIIIDVGMPIMHNGNRYNSRVIALDGRILFIRPKQDLAGTGNYRQVYHFRIMWAIH